MIESLANDAGDIAKVVRMGDGKVNSSLGSQWKNSKISDNVEKQLKQQLKERGIKIPPNSNIPDDLMMNVKL